VEANRDRNTDRRIDVVHRVVSEINADLQVKGVAVHLLILVEINDKVDTNVNGGRHVKNEKPRDIREMIVTGTRSEETVHHFTDLVAKRTSSKQARRDSVEANLTTAFSPDQVAGNQTTKRPKRARGNSVHHTQTLLSMIVQQALPMSGQLVLREIDVGE
jgi:hypothetical protein